MSPYYMGRSAKGFEAVQAQGLLSTYCDTHGTDSVRAVSNLALLSENLEKPFTGVNPLRGQNDAQGASDMGAVPDMYPVYQKAETQPYKKKLRRPGTG